MIRNFILVGYNINVVLGYFDIIYISWGIYEVSIIDK